MLYTTYYPIKQLRFSHHSIAVCFIDKASKTNQHDHATCQQLTSDLVTVLFVGSIVSTPEIEIWQKCCGWQKLAFDVMQSSGFSVYIACILCE